MKRSKNWYDRLMKYSQKRKAVVMIPTYNERENIEDLITEILALDVGLSVVVADDNSPDGTGVIVQKMAESDDRVHALIRKKRRGRGAGGIDGFKDLKAAEESLPEIAPGGQGS